MPAPTTPTTKEVSDSIIAQLESTLSQTIPLLPKSFLRVLSRVLAAVFITLYKYIGWMFLQIFVQTASIKTTDINGNDISPLTAWGNLIGEEPQQAATQAQLLVDVTVLNQTGSIAAGQQLVGSINGVIYITTAATLLDASVKQITIKAVNDQAGGNGSGVQGNLEPGAIVSFANPLPNILSDTVVDSQVVTAAEGESTESYRQRIIDAFQKRPQGGAYSDYEDWGEEVEGIVGVWPYTSANPGQVDCYVEATVASSGDPDGIPTSAQLQAVLDSIELNSAGLATRRPATALANTFAIDRIAFDVVVSGLAVDNLAQVQADITAAITEYFLTREPFIPGLSVPPRKDIISRSAVAGIVSIIVSSVGGLFNSVVVKYLTIPIEQQALDEGEKAKAGVISYI